MKFQGVKDSATLQTIYIVNFKLIMVFAPARYARQPLWGALGRLCKGFVPVKVGFANLNLRYPPPHKFAHFVVCYKRHLLLTFYLGFRP